ncbi:rod shape-determining protein mred [hydrocarbon metagenome]|uniref:Rod shape-determining protein mred n=1 Tax=hydrocarbon metagenome TaxID=938273 RepID=A0A0W8G163_9ZZZZ
MKKEYIIYFTIFIPILVLQLSVVPLVSIDYFAPDLIIILLVYFTLINGQLSGMVAGAVSGLFFDLFSGNLLGLAMFSKTIAAFSAGYFYNENKIESNTGVLNFALIVFLSAFIDSFFNGIFRDNQSVGIIFIIFEKSLFPAIYSAIVGALFIIILPKRKLL